MTIRTRKAIRSQWNRVGFALLLVFAGVMTAPGAQAQSLVTLDTGAFGGQGTFYLDFQLLDGSGVGDGNSMVTLSSMALTNGSLGVALPKTGDVSGDPTQTAGLAMTDSDASGIAEYIQPFTVVGPASQLQFTVSLKTSSPLDSPLPDVFNFLILGSDGSTPLPTEGPTSVELMSSIFDSVPPSLTSYGTAELSPITLAAPTVQPLQNGTPEPSAGIVFFVGSLSLAFSLRRRISLKS